MAQTRWQRLGQSELDRYFSAPENRNVLAYAPDRRASPKRRLECYQPSNWRARYRSGVAQGTSGVDQQHGNDHSPEERIDLAMRRE